MHGEPHSGRALACCRFMPPRHDRMARDLSGKLDAARTERDAPREELARIPKRGYDGVGDEAAAVHP